MKTPWGELAVADAHAHLFSRRFFEALNRQRAEPAEDLDGLISGWGWEPPPDENAALADRWVAELDRYGVERTVLIASVPADEDSVAEVLRAHPSRFYGYFLLNPLAEDSVERARRALDELGLQGICLFPAMFGFSVRDERLQPIYALAAQRPGTVVFVHMGALSVGVRGKFGLPSAFDLAYSNPLELHAVAQKYGNVPFVLPHFGSGLFREALMLAKLAPNVYFDTSSSNAWMRYQNPPLALDQVFRQALEILGPQRLLFGSDSSFFPRGWQRPTFDAQAEALADIGVEGEAAPAIFGGNLRRLLDRNGP